MCRVRNQIDDAIQVVAGGSVELCWLIKNESKQTWPRFPVLRNVTLSEKVNSCIPPDQFSPDLLVQTKLGSQAEYRLAFHQELPASLPSGVYILKFQLVDPYVELRHKKDSKFGDIMTAALEVVNDGPQELS